MRKAEGQGSFIDCIQRLGGSFRAAHHQLLLLICFAWASGSSADESPQLMVLGVAQDAGYPQIDCFELRCIPLWESAPMQSGASSLALVTADSRVLLFDAAPELPQQFYTLWQATGHSRCRYQRNIPDPRSHGPLPGACLLRQRGD